VCGVAGYYSPSQPVMGLATLVAMTRAIAHRGPDDEGVLAIDSRARRTSDDCDAPFVHDVGLGHCRFSIVDPSPAGHQPFRSRDGALALVFNGEIYNHVALREELVKRGHVFRSASDTEVLLVAYAEWGLECFARLHGFWAFALYDLRRRRLVLSRDRIGKSPLYTAVVGGTLYFASEIKALKLACGADAFPVREQAIHDFVHHGWRDVGHGTFYEGITTLDNASYAVLEGSDPVPRPQRFWSLPERRLSERELCFEEARAELRRRLDRAVALRERADVPVAMELSGGMDSSSLVALRATRGDRFAVYSVVFDAPEADESRFANAVAGHFPGRIEHHRVRPELLEFWPQADAFCALMDEPFHSPNVLTNHRLRSRIRADGYRVVVVGSGGDELLAGYPDLYLASFVRDCLRRGRLAAAARELLRADHPAGLLRAVLAGAAGPEPGPLARELVPLASRREDAPPARFDARLAGDWGSWRMNQWLRVGNLLQYAIPIESRSPFMDHRVAEWAFALPATYLIRGGWTKYALRRAVEDLLPAEVVWRRHKMGYPFPLASWLRRSKAVVLRNAAGEAPAGLRADLLPGAFDALLARDPGWLWRFVCVLLWHRRCNRGEPISADARDA
jgi:asparagine synthase (glutamine-hydrolysing)